MEDEDESPTHWDVYYSRPEKADVSEYMFPFGRVAEYLEPGFLRVVASETRFLVVGCGLSALGEELHDSLGGDVREVMSVDISKHCVEHLRRRNLHRPRMHFAVEDMTQSSFAAGSYDVIVDKGLLDDTLAFSRCTEDPGPARGLAADAGERTACAFLWEVRRVLDVGGIFVCISIHGRAHLDALLLSSRLEFDDVYHVDLGGEVEHHLYVCRTSSTSGPFTPSPGDFELYLGDVLHVKYTEVMRLLTAERAEKLRQLFKRDCCTIVTSDGFVRRSVAELHAKAFTRDEREQYDLPDFIDDLSVFFEERYSPLGACADAGAAADDGGASEGASSPSTVSSETMLSCDEFLRFLQHAQ